MPGFIYSPVYSIGIGIGIGVTAARNLAKVYSRLASSAMAFYVDDEEAWKCLKHPSKRRKTGICPTCLRDRLKALCPNCANVRPCDCSATQAESSSSSSSSSFSLFSRSGSKSATAAAGATARDCEPELLDGEPSFRRVRSVAFPFLRSRFSSVREQAGAKTPAPASKSKSSFWSVFKIKKSKKKDGELKKSDEMIADDFAKLMNMRSRSVRVPVSAGAGDLSSPSVKRSGWHFPSPMRAFRHTKMSKVDQGHSPL